jgi:uncharacterized membrane protein
VKKITEFLKTCAMGGLLVLLPLLLLYLVLTEAVQLIVTLATPIADLFPVGTFDKLEHPVLLALLLLLFVSFVFGLALRLAILCRMGDWVERTVLARVPAFNAIKHLSRGLVGATDEHALFRSAVVTSAEGERRLAYLVEDHGDGLATVLIPRPPTAFAGDLIVVPRERVALLKAGLGEVSAVISHWGLGLRALLETEQSRESE